MTLKREKIFLHDTLAQDDALPYQVWSEKVQQLRRSGPDENSVTLWTFAVILTSSTTKQCNLSTRQPSLWWCAIKPKFGWKRTSTSENKEESHILITWAFTVTLTIKTAKPSFHTLAIVLHHHTSLVTNSSAVQKISSGQTIIDIMKFCCDLDLEHSNPFFSPQHTLTHN